MSSLSGMRPGTGMWRMVLALVRQRRRLWLATFAVALSVGYLAGALTLLNRVSEGLADLSSAGAEKADLVIEGDVAYESALEQTRRLIPSSIGQSLLGQDGIAAVVPRVEDVVMLIGPTGQALVTPGLSEQPLGSNWPDDPKMSPYRFVGKGRAPVASDEVVIDHRSAVKAGLSVGDQIGVAARSGAAKYKIVGIVTTDRGDLPDGSSLALFSTEEARELFQMEDNDNRVAIRLDEGVDADEVESQIQAWLPQGSIIVDGATGAMHRQESLTRSFTLIRVLIMGFAGLALVVGMVTVANSLTLLYSERRHSFATFRLVGAKRSQIMGSALTEAAMLAGVASLLGAPLGLVLGGLIEVVLGLLGTSVPVAGSFVSVPALLTAVAVGAVATVLAAVVPAWKACGVPAIEAVVDAESRREPPYAQRLARAAAVSAAVAVVTLGFLNIGGLFVGSTVRVSLIVGLVVLALSQMPTALAHAVALGIHAVPERSGALRRIGARDAIRNRTRTAATTGALMLATAVVVGLAVFLSSFASSLNSDVSGLVSADLVIDSGTFTVGSLPKGLIDQVSEVDGVKSVSGWQLGRVSINQIPVRVTGMDGASLRDVIAPEWVGKAPKTLSREGIALSRSLADQLGVRLGEEVPVFFASYATVRMTVEGIYDSGEVLLGGAVVNRSLLTEQIPKSNDIFALVALKDNSPEARATVTKLAKSFGVKSVLRPEDFVDSRSALLKGFERVIQWMLLFTLLQALVGVVNTLLLSVGERRREFGLLRAAGASRRQVLRLVLVEGGSFAVVGTVLGLVVGIVAARIAIGALGQFGITGFTVPIPIVIITALAASSLGVIAAVIPARWAAAVPPLEAVMDSGGDASQAGLLRRAQTWITERQAAKARRGTQSMPAATTAAAAVRKLSVAPLSGPSAPPVAASGSVAEAARDAVPPPFDPSRLSRPVSTIASQSVESQPVGRPPAEPPTVRSQPAAARPVAPEPVEPVEPATPQPDAPRTATPQPDAPPPVAPQPDVAAPDVAAPAAWLRPTTTGPVDPTRLAEHGPRPTENAPHEAPWGPPHGGPSHSGHSRSGASNSSSRSGGDRRARSAPTGGRDSVLFAPGGGIAGVVSSDSRPANVPPVLQDALASLVPQSVRDAAPVLPTLADSLEPGEVVTGIIQGWAKGLACVVARTDKRVIVVANRFPEPLVESLHPTRTGISLYGPPGVGHVSVAIIDRRRLLEVSGVLDRSAAMALRSDSTKTSRRRGYF